MLNFGSAFYELKNKLQPLYDEREAVAIAHELLQYITGLGKTDRLLKKDQLFNEKQQKQYDKATTELLNGRPLQYITGSAWFMEKKYMINEHVLIPRPETEELVQWIIQNSKFKTCRQAGRFKNSKSPSKFDILDIGTGSGCIPVSLKLAIPEARVTSCDISNEALTVAKKNAEQLGADIQFIELDFLNASLRNKLGTYDIIVSNPPYIPVTDKENLHPNVKDHEPAIALFVPGDDPLLFYRTIAEFGKNHLKSNGYIYCELEVSYAMDCKRLFESEGYLNAEARKDMHGNWRMLKAGLMVDG